MLASIGSFIVDGGFPVYVLLIFGAVGIAFIYERVRSLYYDYGVDANEFTSKIKEHILSGRKEEAIAYCNSQGNALLPYVVRHVLERSDRDDEQIYTAYELAAADVVPLVNKRMGHLAMMANVATLIGLLGTIYGLIACFNAVSFADPSQKQTLLAQGISLAMNTTAMGLMVAIPIMIMYSVLQSRQNQLFEEIVGNSKKIVDLLLSRNYEAFDEEKAYPTTGTGVKAKAATPPPTMKKKVS